jgi:diguanylate cyclase (GGDEF)-like protein
VVEINRQQRHLFILLILILTIAFITTISLSYIVARNNIRKSIIENELPLTGDSIYSEIQRDLIKPVFVADQMAHNTFLLDWIAAGEQDANAMIRYLAEIKARYNAFTAFFASENTRRYFTEYNISKTIDDRDSWFFRVRSMQELYEINFDRDERHGNWLTVFINFKIVDAAGRFLGVTGVSLSSDVIMNLVNDYKHKFNREIAFYDLAGNNAFYDPSSESRPTPLQQLPGLGSLAESILNASPIQTKLSYQNAMHGSLTHVNSRFIPELKWYLVISQDEHESLKPLGHVLFLNLVIGLVATVAVLVVTLWVVARYQRRLLHVAVTDKLTGIANRSSGDAKFLQVRAASQNTGEPFSVMLIDCDRFKQVNDDYGHLVGDQVIAGLAKLIRHNIRGTDYVTRWGGEEFMVLMPQANSTGAKMRAEALRAAVEQHVFTIDVHTFTKTVSIGVAEWNGTESDEALFARVDQALIASKRTGRNRVTVSEAIK